MLSESGGASRPPIETEGSFAMNSPDQLELARSQTRMEARRDPDNSTVKTILLHVQNDASLEQRLENALALARACEAHLSCLHVTPIEAYVAFDSFGGVFVMNDVIKALDKEEAALRSRMEDHLKREDVSWDYEQITGDVVSQIVSHSALADLTVTGRAAHRSDFPGPAIGLLGDLLYRSRTPLFIPADDGPPLDPTGTALIAWDGSYEAANAVRSAIGLLKLAADVRVLNVQEGKSENFPGTRLLKYLSRHGIHTELRVEPAGKSKGDPRSVADQIVSEARNLGAAYIVMGGYNHSRIGEYIFGGVTRKMLSGCTVPLVIAH